MGFNRIVIRLYNIGIILFAGTLLIGNALAGDYDPDQEFETGIRFFKESRYSDALLHFLQAREAGLSHNKLNYNLGVTFYKLQDYRSAYNELIKATHDPFLASIAHLNAGFAAQKMNKVQLSRQHFELASTLAKTPKQLQMAQLALASLINKPKKQPNFHWRVSAQANYGNNDHVTFESKNRETANPDTGRNGSTSEGISIANTPNDDTYYTYYGYAGANFFNFSSLELSAYQLDYQILDDYDFLKYNLRLNFFTYKKLSNLKLSGEYEYNFLGNQDYQTRTTLALLSRQSLWKNGYVDMHYYYTDIKINNKTNYQYLNGDLQHFEAKLSQVYGANKKLGMALHFENNNRADYFDEHGFLSSSFSPRRRSIDVFAQYSIFSNVWIDMQTKFTQSNYPSVTTIVEISNDLMVLPDGYIVLPDGTLVSVDTIITKGEHNFIEQGETTRIDNRLSASLSLYGRVNKYFLVNVSYFYLNNDSNLDFYTFTSNRYSLGIMLQF